LLLSAVLAGATLYLTRQNLLREREDQAIRSAIENAASVESLIGTTTGDTEPQLDSALDAAKMPEGSYAILRYGDQTKEPSNRFTGADIPESLQSLVEQGFTARMRTKIDGSPFMMIGVSLTRGRVTQIAYYQATELTDVEDTLDALFLILSGAAGATALLGALLGAWASRRTLGELTDVSEAAEAIASGRLETRLDIPADRDLARLASSFNDMAGALQERIERDSRFASEVSHELRSPLMTLTASVEVLETRRDELPDRAQVAVDLLSSDLTRFKQLVEDLLEISRFDVGTARLELDDLNVTEFCRLATARASETPIPLRYLPAVGSKVILGDKRRLARVVTNLVENAAKYGDGATSIEIVDHGSTVQIAVEDNGPGVPREERSVIFDRFSRGSAGGRRGSDSGVGLGLSLVAEHVGLHGGRVWVEDRTDGRPGARFVVELPEDPEAR
jgi:two-component system sensor histidine kinase MtrB